MVHINYDIENAITIAQHVLHFRPHNQKTDQYHRTYQTSHERLHADIFTLKIKQYFCIVEYLTTFPVIKQMDWLSADGLIKTCTIIFCRIWITKNNNVCCWHKFCFRKVVRIQEVSKHPSDCIIIIQPSEQWESKNICKAHWKEMFWHEKWCISSFVADIFNNHWYRTT